MQKIAHFCKHAGIKIALFLRSNWAYILWFALHYLLAVAILSGVLRDAKMAYLWAGIAYAISIGIALSPVGEFILRVLQDAHAIETEQDSNYLMPLFEEVYQEAYAKTPSMHKNIRLYISEEKTINAHAMGRKTIVLTRGAIETFHREELKGILAHEFGHMANGDTKASLLTIIGDGVFSIIIMLFKLILRMFMFFIGFITDNQIWASITSFIVRLLFDYSVLLFMFLGNVILSLNSRYSEYLADSFAYQIGFGEQLKRSLYLLNKLNMGGRRTLREWLMASHPHTNARIKRLEQKLALEQA